MTYIKKVLQPKDQLTATVNVENTGERAGQEVVQMYLSDLYRSSLTPPVKQLRAFSKISLKPKEIKKVSFKVSLKDLSFIGRANKRIAETGEFKIEIGPLQKNFILKN